MNNNSYLVYPKLFRTFCGTEERVDFYRGLFVLFAFPLFFAFFLIDVLVLLPMHVLFIKVNRGKWESRADELAGNPMIEKIASSMIENFRCKIEIDRKESSESIYKKTCRFYFIRSDQITCTEYYENCLGISSFDYDGNIFSWYGNYEKLKKVGDKISVALSIAKTFENKYREKYLTAYTLDIKVRHATIFGDVVLEIRHKEKNTKPKEKVTLLKW